MQQKLLVLSSSQWHIPDQQTGEIKSYYSCQAVDLSQPLDNENLRGCLPTKYTLNSKQVFEKLGKLPTPQQFECSIVYVPSKGQLKGLINDVKLV